MSRSSRTSVSNWDTKDTEHGIRRRKPGESFTYSKSEARERSPQLAGGSDSECHGVESSAKADRKFPDALLARNRERSCSAKMSPGLEDWRQQYQSHSPRTGWGRSYRSQSRSRSPPGGFNRESGLPGRNNADQTCRDFAAGRCRRGDHCPYLHQGDTEYADRRFTDEGLTNGWKNLQRMDDRRENLESGGRYDDLCSDYMEGGCYDWKSCRFAHNNVVSGNCRKGKFCRFSHHGKTDNPNDRSHDDWRRPSSDSDVVEQPGEHLRRRGPILSDHAKMLQCDEDKNEKVVAHEQRDTPYSRDGGWVSSVNIENRSLGHPPNNGGPVDCNDREYLQPYNKTTAGSGGFESDVAESWFADMEVSSPWSSRQTLGHVVREGSGPISQTTLPSFQMYEQGIKVADSSFAASDWPVSNIDPKHSAMDQHGPCSKEYLQPKDESIASLVDCEFKGAEDWFADMEVSSPWNPGQSFSHFVKKECGQITQMTHSVVHNVLSLQRHQQVITGEMLGQKHQVIATMPPMKSGNAFFELKPNSKEGPGSISSDCPVSSTFPGQNQHMLPLYGPGGESTITAQNRPLFQDGKSPGKPDALNGNKSGLPTEILPTQNILNGEQLSHFDNLSALSQLIGNAHQRSLLGSVPNPPNSMTFVSPNSITGSERRYDPLIDSIESVQCHKDNPLLGGLLPSPSEGKVVACNQQEVPSKDILSSPTTEGNNVTVVAESKKAQENGSLENVNGDGRVDESKKKSNGKAIRAFKFALAEFVKEILQPKWKEGEINRDSYKAIVKKVVDKVAGSVQGAHIPQSQENIDHYLTSSKLKVTKLVEAYLERQQKT
ncbi:hypothetical protein Vadar_001626 [Vaccinium darrowii]|uniref:Uncharacterized protein n=1 Tax=Vaccinium darrowii TaxID=229202 RepID=A0ACB7Z1I0_9ERIC|nr:hypothetical protein Vadar_001626 [Vaccinium darrowii]